MRVWRWLVIFVLSCIAIYAIEVSPTREHQPLLSYTQIYIDYNRTTTIKTIHKKPFDSIDQESIGLGYSPDLNIWIKIELHNLTDDPIQKILEYANPLTTHIELYDGQRQVLLAVAGLLQNNTHRQTLNPYFELTLKPKEYKTYYLKASSMTSLVLQLELWSPRGFYDHALQLRSLLSLFFGAIFIIILYNLIIYFITKEVSYLYYVLFFVSVALHQFNYRGVLAFTLSPDTIRLLIEYATFIVAAPVFFLMLFTREVLDLKQYIKVSKLFTVLLWLFPLSMVLIYLLGLNHLRAVFSVSMLFTLFITTCYALYRQNRQAKYLTLGWALFWTASLLMYLSNIGVYNIFNKIPFYTELTLVAEALIFAFSLAIMIKQSNQEKLDTQNKYITLQEEKEHQLTEKVDERTKQLSKSLQEKDILLKELNHRVKNSIQTIVSFLRLQIDDTENEEVRRTLTNIENRILSINHLYALLHTKENLMHIDAYEYFKLLITTIQNGFHQENIEIRVHATVQLPSQTAVYCGFILNEALTNALQHAFTENQKGYVEISLVEHEDNYLMQIKDNGSGFDATKEFSSLGLTILELLATEQLDGTLELNTTEGTMITIKWKEKDE